MGVKLKVQLECDHYLYRPGCETCPVTVDTTATLFEEYEDDGALECVELSVDLPISWVKLSNRYFCPKHGSELSALSMRTEK